MTSSRFLLAVFSLLGAVTCSACSARSLDGGETTPPGSGIGGLGSDGGGDRDGGPGGLSSTEAVCTDGQDQTCNDDATISSFAGKCVSGRCKCIAGAELVPGGKCRSAVKGVGSSCAKTSECYAGLECLDFAVHPQDGGCSIVGKQCTVACDSRSQQSCSDFGPGVFCFGGCSGSAGICGQTP